MKRDELVKIIENEYNLKVDAIKPAQRQFVAETFVIKDINNKKYFCKVIEKPLFIPRVIKSLPILEEMHKQGIQRINYPLRTMLKNSLYIKRNNTLIVLFNYINAQQSYNYDKTELGKLIARVHKITSKIRLSIPMEEFSFKRRLAFEKHFENIIKGSFNDTILNSLKKCLLKYEKEIRHDLTNFSKTAIICKKIKVNMVITHGDAPGNTLVKSPADIYLVDWDDILLAPAERDIWFLIDDSSFMSGYREVYSKYKVNEDLRRYFIYKRYFEDLTEYFEEITGGHSEEHRKKNLQGLRDDCFEGWLRPAIRDFDPL